jgi:hypothetical protein
VFGNRQRLTCLQFWLINVPAYWFINVIGELHCHIELFISPICRFGVYELGSACGAWSVHIRKLLQVLHFHVMDLRYWVPLLTLPQGFLQSYTTNLNLQWRDTYFHSTGLLCSHTKALSKIIFCMCWASVHYLGKLHAVIGPCVWGLLR